MHISHIAFYAMLLFLIGVGLFLYFGNLWIVLIGALVIGGALCTAGWQKKNKKVFILGTLCVCAALGSLYSAAYVRRAESVFFAPFEKLTTFRARVVDDPAAKVSTQQAVVEFLKPHQGKILLVVSKYPSLRYGDMIRFQAEIATPFPEGYANYLAKDGIYGVARYPKRIEVIGWSGSKIKSALFSLKKSFEENISRALPSQEAAFMNGILLGERAEFSQEFKEYMKLSGTTHLIALSGYNISIIASSVAALLLYLGMGKRWAFWVSLAVIIGFVIMTGAQASVVRAAIMGSILLLSGYMETLHNIRNAIMVAAVIMVVVNPYVIRYDAGFQLSFLALLGIVYLVPSVANALRVKYANSFLSWKEHALSTFSAQLFVMPVLLNNFHIFSPVSFLTNILILEIIPATMLLGFLLGMAGYVSSFLSGLFGWVAYIPLAYATRLITFTGALHVSFSVETVHVAITILYYVLLAWFIKKYYPKPVVAHHDKQ